MTNVLSGLSVGFGFVFDGFRLIFQPGIRRFVIIPFMVNIAVFTTAIRVGLWVFDSFLQSLINWLPAWLDWIQWLIWPLIILLVMIVVYYSFTLVANFLAAPFNSLLSQRVENDLRGAVAKETGTNLTLGLVGRTVLSEARKILYQIKWLVLLAILSIIPFINVFAPVAWVYFGARMLSVEYVEYPISNKGLFFKQVRLRIKADRFASIGFGLGVMIITLVPMLNFFAMPVAVAGATSYWVNRLEKQSNSPDLTD